MAVRITTDRATGARTVRFVLPDDVHPGPVSLVGSFNDWTPGTHRLVKRSNGTRSVAVAAVPGQPLVFRYLGSGGVWFDDPDADRVPEGGLVHA